MRLLKVLFDYFSCSCFAFSLVYCRRRMKSSCSMTSGSKSFCLNITKLNREISMAKLETTRETKTSQWECRISDFSSCMNIRKYRWIVSCGKS